MIVKMKVGGPERGENGPSRTSDRSSLDGQTKTSCQKTGHFRWINFIRILIIISGRQLAKNRRENEFRSTQESTTTNLTRHRVNS